MVYCPRCGRLNSADSIYCAYCGSTMSRIDVRRLEGATKDLRDRLRRAVSSSGEGPTWRWLPIVAMMVYVFGTAALMLFTFARMFSFMSDPDSYTYFDWLTGYAIFSALVSLITHLLLGASVYKVLDVRGRHCAREAALKNAISDYVNKVADATEVPLTLQPVRGAMLDRESRDSLIRAEAGPQHSPLLWAILIVLGPLAWTIATTNMYGPEFHVDPVILVPSIIAIFVLYIVFLYMLYKWTKEMSQHDQQWRTFAGGTRAALNRLGFDTGRLPWPGGISDRSAVLFLILSIFLGIIIISIWVFMIIDDQNTHIAQQKEFESALLDLVEPGSRFRERPAQAPLQ